MKRLLPWGAVRTPSVLQLEAAECGAASLAMVLGYFGRHAPLEELRTLCGVSRDGSKASTLLKAARTYGLEAKGLKVEPEHLKDIKPPMIAFVNFNHFLVVEGVRGNRVYLNDPATGRRVVTMEEFSEGYTGVVLSFTKGPEFRKGDTRPPVWRALARRLTGFRTALWFVFLISLAMVIPGIIVPIFSRVFVDYVLVRGLEDWVFVLLLGMGLTAVVRFILLELQSQTLLRITNGLTLETGRKLFAHLLSLPISFFDQRFAGEVADRVRLNENLAELLTGQLVGAAISVVTTVFFAVVMFLYHPLLALTVVGIALLNIVVLTASSRALSDKYRKISIDEGKLQGTRISALKDMETYKASGAEDIVFSRWMGLQTNVVNGRQAAARTSAWISQVPGLLSALIAAVVLIGGGYLVMQGEMTLGMLVAFQSLSISFTTPISQLAGFGAELQQVRSYTQRLEDVLEQKPDPRFEEESDAPIDRLPGGAVHLKDVSFGYAPLAPPLIDGLNLDIRPGQRVALVGASGSGKTTVGKLIAGLEVPQSGEVLIDGITPQKWQRKALATRFAYVQQDITLFEGTTRENLSLWDGTIPEAAMIRAAHDAQIHSVISTRAGGYDAILTEGGSNFSGGERQRIEIARALATDPSIIVLDEATSALDPVSEQGVMDAIRRRGATCIIIAHRLSTIRDCDEIIVLDHGVPVERGTHEQLLTAGGTYANLIEN